MVDFRYQFSRSHLHFIPVGFYVVEMTFTDPPGYRQCYRAIDHSDMTSFLTFLSCRQSFLVTVRAVPAPFDNLRQGGYVIVVVCLSVCLLATLGKHFRTDLHEIFREGWQWANEQMIKFWW